MCAKESHSNSATQYRLGNALIWFGILTWLPFIVLRLMGESPSLFWFLPLHLAGVIGGARMRTSARNAMRLPPSPKSRMRKLGHSLIIAGILVWAPYFYLKIVSHQTVEVMNYLPFHLVGILGGITMTTIDHLCCKKAR